MRYSIGELSKLSGVTVRALRYYGSMGLLPASEVAESGYRYYDDAGAERLRDIMFFRELGFSLAEVSELTELPEAARRERIAKQRELLELKRDRLNGLIRLLCDIEKGEKKMDFSAFDDSALENARAEYAKEARERWGDTKAYAQSEKNEAGRTKTQKTALDGEMRSLMDEFAAASKVCAPDSNEAAALVRKWQAFITANYYECSDEILSGLGAMYSGDERFKANINESGDGTAEFMSAAIESYCAR